MHDSFRTQHLHANGRDDLVGFPVAWTVVFQIFLDHHSTENYLGIFLLREASLFVREHYNRLGALCGSATQIFRTLWRALDVVHN